MGRTDPCTRADARNRLGQAEAFAQVAGLVLDESLGAAVDLTDADVQLDEHTPLPGVAAALAVLAGIAAADAACCAALKERYRGDAHAAAPKLVRTVEPRGPELSKWLKSLVEHKDQAHYGLRSVPRDIAKAMVHTANQMVEAATEVVDRV